MTLSNDAVLYAETQQVYTVTTAHNHANPINCSAYVEGVFVLEVSQAGTWADETIDVVIETYNSYTETWHTIASFTQVTDADSGTGTQREVIKIPHGLGTSISCSWTIANMNSGKEYTLSISGTLKS